MLGIGKNKGGVMITWHKNLLVFLLLIPASLYPLGTTVRTLALVDMAEHEEYIYQSFIALAKAAGFTATYMPVSKVLALEEGELAKFDAAFFLLNQEYIVSLNTPNSANTLAKTVLTMLGQYGALPGKLVGVLVPSIGMPQAYTPIFKELGLVGVEGNEKAVQLISTFLQHPLETRVVNYETTLLPAHSGAQVASYVSQGLATLPINQDGFKELSGILPLGIYYHNAARSNNLFVGALSAFVGLGIVENFKLAPMHTKTREQFLLALAQTLRELSKIIDTNKVVESALSGGTSKLALPAHVRTLPARKMRTPFKYSWMGIEFFGDATKEREAQGLIDYIYEAGLTHVWLTLAPNWYFSPHARKADQKEIMLKQLALFMSALRAGSKKYNAAVPKLMIGFEIANNLGNVPGAKDVPKPSASDLFGNTYFDVPAPLDKNFWNNEVLYSLREFLYAWNEYKLVHNFYNDVGFEGIVFDFEMYNRKTTGIFLSTMGYEPENLKEYATLKRLDPSLDSNELARRHLLSDYRTFLQKKAYDLGVYMRQEIHSLMPGATIGCYAPALQVTWPYKQFFQGFDTNNSNKLHLLTFNAQFRPHKPWLEEHNIHAKHMSALMLSKVDSEVRMDLARDILGKHDGVWLNRMQWAVLPHASKEWYSLEQSPLSPVRIQGAFKRLKKF
jgi:hypothetical protein